MATLTLGFAPTTKSQRSQPALDPIQTSAPLTSTERILEEFRTSAIPDALTLANVAWVQGPTAVEILAEHAIAQVQSVTSYVTTPAQRILERYEFAASGGWVAYGTTLSGGIGSVAYFKAKCPRRDFERHRPIKYESPAKTAALPLLPFVDDASAAAIYQKHGVTPFAGEPFWQVVHRCNLPIALTEGLKKALSLIACCIPAIALRGVTQWHKKGTNELHPEIAQFTTAKRTFYVIFDEDEKAITRDNIHQQRMKLAAALEQAGCIVSLPLWDGQALGKGIDDVLLGQGDLAQGWLDTLLQQAPSVKILRYGDRLRKASDLLHKLNRLSYPIERATEGEYLPELPALLRGAIHVLSASMNAGKTTRIGLDWVKSAISRGYNVLVLSPLNSLGEQTAQTWGLPHIHNYDTSAEQQNFLWMDVRQSHGIVMCPDSLHRLPPWFFNRPVLLVLDEANQVISHTTQGNTTQSRYSQILECLTTAARHAIQNGAIVLSEDGLPDRAVQFIQSISGLSGAETVRAFTHRKQGKPWDCTVYKGQVSGFRRQFIAAAGDNRLLYVTTSQQEAKKLERALQQQRPELKVIRIDSETNQGGTYSEFFRNPDRWLEVQQPDVLILSPSAKSGVSIQGGVSVQSAYFSQVWGYFPALGTDSHMQLLGRYRPSVPRVMFCPNFILSSADEALLYPRAIARQLSRNAKLLAGVYGLHDLLNVEGDRAELVSTVETAVQAFLTAEIAVTGHQKLMSHAQLVSRLEAAGHAVTSEQCVKDAAMTDLWKGITESLWREQATAFANAAISDEQHTAEWAHKTLDSQDSSYQTRILAQKVLLRDEFPGVLFNGDEECYQALCKDYGAMRRGVTLQAKAENLEAAKAVDRSSTEAILSKPIRALHRLPRGAVLATLIAQTGILALLDGSTYHNHDARVKAIRETALKLRHHISYWLRLQINETQTPVEVANKLIKKLGLSATAISRPGRRGQQSDRHYQVTGWDDPIRLRLLEAIRHRLSDSVSTICNQKNTYLQIVDTPPNSPPSPTRWTTAEELADVRGWQAAALADPNDAAISQLLSLVPPEVLRRATA